MRQSYIFIKITLFFVGISIPLEATPKPPKIMIGFVVDQFAYHYLYKVRPYLTGGLKELFDNGIEYKNTYMPHGCPATGPGHVTISTGTVPKNHGIIGNAWKKVNGKKVNYETFNANIKYAVFSPKGTYNYAMSADNIMVDNISDQFVLHSNPGCNRQVFALSHKGRAAIGLGGKLGKAIWFDRDARRFTTSKAYFDKMPAWLSKFNAHYLPKKSPQNLLWQLYYPKDSSAYNSAENDYAFATQPFSMIESEFCKIKAGKDSEYGELYIKTPHANQHLLDLARTCLRENLTKNPDDQFMLWISLSPLDPLGHYYGPDSKETIDLIYHLDWQIKRFMKHIQKKIDPKEILYVLTADHGVMPIPELLTKKGIRNIHRINDSDLVKKINQHIFHTLNIQNVAEFLLNSQIYLQKEVFYNLPLADRSKVISAIKAYVQKQPGIRNVWSTEELSHEKVTKGSPDEFLKNQIYKGRSGELVYKTHPYITVSKRDRGTSHQTPYEYDTHIPLVIYQKGSLFNKRVEQKVYITQLANSLAKIFNIAKPSASIENPLPEI